MPSPGVLTDYSFLGANGCQQELHSIAQMCDGLATPMSEVEQIKSVPGGVQLSICFTMARIVAHISCAERNLREQGFEEQSSGMHEILKDIFLRRDASTMGAATLSEAATRIRSITATFGIESLSLPRLDRTKDE